VHSEDRRCPAVRYVSLNSSDHHAATCAPANAQVGIPRSRRRCHPVAAHATPRAARGSTAGRVPIRLWPAQPRAQLECAEGQERPLRAGRLHAPGTWKTVSGSQSAPDEIEQPPAPATHLGLRRRPSGCGRARTRGSRPRTPREGRQRSPGAGIRTELIEVPQHARRRSVALSVAEVSQSIRPGSDGEITMICTAPSMSARGTPLALLKPAAADRSNRPDTPPRERRPPSRPPGPASSRAMRLRLRRL
jgi:hypothetical protein